jgi:hypothetical protein
LAGSTTFAASASASTGSAPRPAAAANAGSSARPRPAFTSWFAAPADSRACPRSQDAIVALPSCSAAPATSQRRTVRATSAMARFATASSGPSRSISAGPASSSTGSPPSASSAPPRQSSGVVQPVERMYEF